jgi:hypothetical protein
MHRQDRTAVVAKGRGMVDIQAQDGLANGRPSHMIYPTLAVLSFRFARDTHTNRDVSYCGLLMAGIRTLRAFKCGQSLRYRYTATRAGQLE